MQELPAAPRGPRLMMSAASLVSIAVLVTASLMTNQDARSLATAAVLTFPYWILLWRAQCHPHPFDRGFAAGTTSTVFGLWMFAGLRLAISERTPLGFVYVAIIVFFWPVAAFSIPLAVAQLVLVGASRRIDGRRWLGFALPPVYAATVIAAVLISQNIQQTRHARELEQRSRPQREAAQARARLLQSLPRGKEAWQVKLPVRFSPGFSLARRSAGDIYVTSGEGVSAVELYKGVRWTNQMQTAVEPAALGPDGRVYVVSHPINPPKRENDRHGVLTAIDPQGETRWSVVVCSSMSSHPLVMRDGTVEVPCFSDGPYSPQDTLLTSVTANGDLRWSVTATRTYSRSWVIARGTAFLTGARITLAHGRFDEGPRQLFAIDGTGHTKWSVAVHGNRVVTTMGDLLVVGGDSHNRLTAVDAAGHTRWSVTLPFPGVTAMTATDGEVIVEYSGDIVSVDSTGMQRWRYRVSSATDNQRDSSALGIGEDGSVYIVGPKDVIALHADGTLAWVYGFDSRERSSIATTAVPVDDGVAVVIHDAKGYWLTLLRATS